MARSKQALPDQDEAAVAHPAGTVISPGQAAPVAPPAAPAETAVAEPTAEAPEPDSAAGPAEAEAPTDDNVDASTVRWTASEFVHHEKSSGWYALLLGGSVVFAVLVYLVTKDVISAGVVVVAAVILAIYASHKPGEQRYSLDKTGINIGQKRYHYDDFKSFAVASEGAFSSLVFMPLKRFAVPLTIYYDPADEEKIVNLLSDRLPLAEHRPDGVDHLMRRIRF